MRCKAARRGGCKAVLRVPLCDRDSAVVAAQQGRRGCVLMEQRGKKMKGIRRLCAGALQRTAAAGGVVMAASDFGTGQGCTQAVRSLGAALLPLQYNSATAKEVKKVAATCLAVVAVGLEGCERCPAIALQGSEPMDVVVGAQGRGRGGLTGLDAEGCREVGCRGGSTGEIRGCKGWQLADRERLVMERSRVGCGALLWEAGVRRCFFWRRGYREGFIGDGGGCENQEGRGFAALI